MSKEFDEEGRWLASLDLIGVFKRGSKCISITKGDVACLSDRLWLNDTAIDLGIQLIIGAELEATKPLSESQPQTRLLERFHAFSIYFSIRLHQVFLAACLILHATPAT
jgi:Ulp1 family protease